MVSVEGSFEGARAWYGIESTPGDYLAAPVAAAAAAARALNPAPRRLVKMGDALVPWRHEVLFVE